jgi:hypothetical protein
MSDNSARKDRAKVIKNKRIPFDEALRRLVNTPPKPHKKSSQTGEPGKGKAKQKQREAR